jgi:hypothetical protein
MTLTPKVLLLVQGNPDHHGIGNILLGEVSQHYPKGSLTRLSLTAKKNRTTSGEWRGHLALAHHVPYSVLPIASSCLHWRFRLCSKRAIVEEVVDLVESADIELVWSVLNSDSMIALTRDLMQRLAIPFVSTAFDSPEYFLRNYRLDPLTKRVLLSDYADVLRGSLRVSVSSGAMGDIYRTRYGVEGIPLVHAFPGGLQLHSDVTPPSDELIIAFAGSLYAKKEWNALLRALQSVDGIVDGRAVKVRFIGRFPRTFAARAPFVELMGHRPVSETLDLLSTAHVAYLPYWFSSRHAYAVRTSFPNKLSTYVACNLPVFFHGPRDSSAAHFIERYPIGVCCHSMESEDILHSLRRLTQDPVILAKAATARQSALEEVIGYEILLRNFAALLGIECSQLTAKL